MHASTNTHTGVTLLYIQLNWSAPWEYSYSLWDATWSGVWAGKGKGFKYFHKWSRWLSEAQRTFDQMIAMTLTNESQIIPGLAKTGTPFLHETQNGVWSGTRAGDQDRNPSLQLQNNFLKIKMCQKKPNKQFSLFASLLPGGALEWTKRTFCEPGQHCSAFSTVDEGQLERGCCCGTLWHRFDLHTHLSGLAGQGRCWCSPGFWHLWQGGIKECLLNAFRFCAQLSLHFSLSNESFFLLLLLLPFAPVHWWFLSAACPFFLLDKILCNRRYTMCRPNGFQLVWYLIHPSNAWKYSTDCFSIILHTGLVCFL